MDSIWLQDTIKPTKILRIPNGNNCPVCKAVAFDCIVTVINRLGKKERILAVNCRCGTVYLTREQYKKLSSPKAYDIELRDTTPLLPHSKNTKSSDNIKICPQCHYTVPSFFADSGMCWDCYKEQMSSRFD